MPAGATDGATYVPVTVFHGTAPGPVLALTTGVHGFEFVPILAAQRLLTRLDPARLRGTVMLVRLAHVEAFEQRVPYVNPFDRKNLNRAVPRQPDGTQTDRIAWTITTEVIRRATTAHRAARRRRRGVDGAVRRRLRRAAGRGAVPTAARAMALAFGFRNVVTLQMKTQAQVDAAAR